MAEVEIPTGTVLMAGNQAAGEAAIRAGCRFYGGYPITPQNELIAYMADHLPLRGGAFVQAESELAAINMVYGASAAGVRAMTSSSSPGVSLKQEGISYLAGSQLPAVIVNMQRSGPGLGGIAPAGSDYYQTTRGGGHGDYRCISLAPAGVQEMADLTHLAFDLADRYLMPVIVLGDAMVGQMVEGVTFDHLEPPEPLEKPWALTGAAGRERNIVKSFFLLKDDLEKHNVMLQERYAQIEENEVRFEAVDCDEAEVLIVAYGTSARIAREVLRHPPQGLSARIGLFRPITLWPFPKRELRELAGRVRGMLTVEMSAGQMVDDVRLAVEGRCPVHFYGRMGGSVPEAEEISEKLIELFT